MPLHCLLANNRRAKLFFNGLLVLTTLIYSAFHLPAQAEEPAPMALPSPGAIKVFGGSLFKQELFDLKMLAHRSKKFTGKERIVAYPIESELCKGLPVRHIQHDVLYELSSTSFIPIETSHASLYHQNGFKEIKNYVAQQLSPNAPIIYYTLGTFTSCDKVSRKEIDDKFRLSLGGGGGFTLAGFYEQQSQSLNRYCLSLRLNTELHPKLLENGYVPPNARTEMCIYADDYKEGENTNVSAVGLVYDKGNYFVRGTPENRVKEILVKGAMISLLSNFIGVPDVALLPFLKNDYIEYEIDSFTRKFKNESPTFQWNMLQATLNHRYRANISYREYGQKSTKTTNTLEHIETGLSKQPPLRIYQKIVRPLFAGNPDSELSTYTGAEAHPFNVKNKSENVPEPWQVRIEKSTCRKVQCTVHVKGKVDANLDLEVKRAMVLAYKGNISADSVQCKTHSKWKYRCILPPGTSGKINEKTFKKQLSNSLDLLRSKTP